MNEKRIVALDVDEIPVCCINISSANGFITEASRRIRLIQGRYDRMGGEDIQIAMMALSNVDDLLQSAIRQIEESYR